MGTSNGTCGVTNLPVTEGERIVMIPLLAGAANRDSEFVGAGLLDNDLIASPVGLHIRGTFDGYGRITPDAGSIALESLVSLAAAYAEDSKLALRQRDDRYVMRKKPLDEQALLDALHSGELAFKFRREAAQPFGCMFVHEATFDRLVQQAGKRMLKGFQFNGEFFAKRHRASSQLELWLDFGRSMGEKELQELRDREARSRGLMTAAHFQYLVANTLLARKAWFAMELTSRAAADKSVSRLITEFILFTDAFNALRKNWQVHGQSQSDLSDAGAYFRIVADSIHEALEA